MSEIYLQPLFGIFITLLAFQLSKLIGRRWKFVLFNPVLLSVVSIICFLVIFEIDFEAYNIGGQYLGFLLGPTVVALGVLFYEKYEQIKANMLPFVSAVVIGGTISIISVCAIALVLGASEPIIRSIAPKSVTTPIALEIAKIIGGVPYISAGIVIAVGIFGNAFGPAILRSMGINNKNAIGAALGTAAHGIGTARALDEGKLPGAYAGLAMCVNGLLTALITPYIVNLVLLLYL
ncbi:Inner membrane protein YohK [Arenibacter antarcticus]|uniref:LrgB family protein n=1 Tax=Arenibacter antarcticus TaxID=2040469 RepID=A0ABW5VBL0_9FLAO|nr:LrgB family protein [Arenibacter sp. H213]MCM4169361.1 LrgB family protein [Arenibacter sp. H213]